MPKSEDKINLQPVHIQVYRFIEKYVAKNIISPELEEVSKGIKITIRHTYRVVDDLCMLGYLSRSKYKRRSVKILKPLR